MKFILIGFLSGSLMFSYWLGIIAGKDLKKVGDGNPGAFNLWSAAGYKIGILGVVLDFMKGYIPIKLMMDAGYLKGSMLVMAGLAPILGHVFSPFMKFKGGKGIAVTFGIWSAVTGFEVSFVYAVILAVLKASSILINKGRPSSSESDALQVVAGMFLTGIYIICRGFSANIIILWCFNLLILIFTNRTKLMTYKRGKCFIKM